MPFFRSHRYRWKRRNSSPTFSHQAAIHCDRARLSREREIYWLPANNRKICRIISICDRVVSNATSAVRQAFPTRFVHAACCPPHHLINDRSRSPMHSTRFSSRKSPTLHADYIRRENNSIISLEIIINAVALLSIVISV